MLGGVKTNRPVGPSTPKGVLFITPRFVFTHFCFLQWIYLFFIQKKTLVPIINTGRDGV